MDNQIKASILVVDDTPENLQLLIGLLQQQDYKVHAAPNGLRAIASVHLNPPDLILLDVKMPEMDGYEVCRRLKADERTQDIPILFISALDELADKIKGFQVGGVDYIIKPFQAEEVLARVETHLALRSLQKGMQAELAWRKQAEEELRALNQQLTAANVSKDTFFSIIAHDLRSPFTGLLGLTEALLEDFDRYEKEKLKALLSRLHESSRQVYTLLNNLLEWSRLERGIIEYHPTILALSPVIEQDLRLVAAAAEQKTLTLSHLVQADIMVYADAQMVQTVIRNLLSNAIKFTEPGGTIQISAKPYAQTVELVVSDTGIGMSQDVMDALFRIDVKSSRPGTAGEKGTGLGLILCQEFVKKNGGTIRVESQSGHGSRFIICLPRQAHH
jgi:two-component system sensor histidine kinase/response regulator